MTVQVGRLPRIGANEGSDLLKGSAECTSPSIVHTNDTSGCVRIFSNSGSVLHFPIVIVDALPIHSPWLLEAPTLEDWQRELELVGEVEGFKSDKDMEDWFVVSAVKSGSEGEKLASFEVDGKTYSIHKATAHKCPRCWKFVSASEDEACMRCTEVVS